MSPQACVNHLAEVCGCDRVPVERCWSMSTSSGPGGHLYMGTWQGLSLHS
jgi:hypothetical protein